MVKELDYGIDIKCTNVLLYTMYISVFIQSYSLPHNIFSLTHLLSQTSTRIFSPARHVIKFYKIKTTDNVILKLSISTSSKFL